MPGCILFRWARAISVWILATVIVSTAVMPCEASGSFSLGAGYSSYKESSALVWDPSWYLTGTCFLDVMSWMQFGLSANYYFIEPRSGSELFGTGVGWEEPQGESSMFSLIPAVRIPFPIGDDGSTQVYLQGGIGWYHFDMDAAYSGTVLVPGGYPVEKTVTEKWDKPGIDGRFGVITRLHNTLFLEISPAISVLFTDVESTWSISGYIAMGMTF